MTEQERYDWYWDQGLVPNEVLRWCRNNLTGLWRYDGFHTLFFYKEADYLLFLLRWS